MYPNSSAEKTLFYAGCSGTEDDEEKWFIYVCSAHKAQHKSFVNYCKVKNDFFIYINVWTIKVEQSIYEYKNS